MVSSWVGSYSLRESLTFITFHRFWFIILATISGVAVLYSLVVIMMPTTRETIIKRSYRSGQRKEIAGLVRRLEVGAQLEYHSYQLYINPFLVFSTDWWLPDLALPEPEPQHKIVQWHAAAALRSARSIPNTIRTIDPWNEPHQPSDLSARGDLRRWQGDGDMSPWPGFGFKTMISMISQ